MSATRIIGGISLLCCLSLITSLDARPSSTETHDKALAKIKACLRHNEAGSRECRDLNKDVETLIDVYRHGDKSVLPTLFRFPYLTDFYGDALLADPEGFLEELTKLSVADQQGIAECLAGGRRRGLEQERFNALRAVLAKIPDLSSAKQAAVVCLKALERINASRLVTYFPPQTFANPLDSEFLLHWFSREMYALGEKPLWPPSSDGETVFRLTYLPAFRGPTYISIKIQPDGTGLVHIKTIDGFRQSATLDNDSAVPQDGTAKFLSELNRANFWDAPAELVKRGYDGAEWILEGVKDGKYHVVVRWCPGEYTKDADEKAFGAAARLLFELAGQKNKGGC
jgi:hypothetical protein